MGRTGTNYKDSVVRIAVCGGCCYCCCFCSTAGICFPHDIVQCRPKDTTLPIRSSRTTRINFCTGTGKLDPNATYQATACNSRADRMEPQPTPVVFYCMPRLTSFARGDLTSVALFGRGVGGCNMRTASVGLPFTLSPTHTRRRASPVQDRPGEFLRQSGPSPSIIQPSTHTPCPTPRPKTRQFTSKKNGPMPFLCIKCISLDSSTSTRQIRPLLLNCLVILPSTAFANM